MNDKTAKPGELLSRFPEINFNNYGQQEVEALQAWALEAFDALSATLSPAHIEDGEEVEVVATVCCSKDGDWYIDALHPSRVGEQGYLVEGDELMTVAQHQRIVAALSAPPAAETEQSIAADCYWHIAEVLNTQDGWSVQEHVEFMREIVQDASEFLHDIPESAVGGDDKAVELCRRIRLCLAGVAPECAPPLFPAPPAAGTTSDQYRAELYDEVWQKARDLGYGNVSDALVELERIKAAPPAADPWTPSGFDYDRGIHHNPDAKAWADLFVATFPGLADKHGLMIGWFANAMMAMHDWLKSKEEAAPPAAGVPEIPVQWAKSLSHCWPQCLDEPDGDWCVGTVDEDGHFYEVLLVEAAQYDAPGESQKIAEAIVALWSFADAPIPPASGQQRAVVMPERGVYPSMSMYPDGKEYAAAVGEVSGRNACLDELLRLNPHLAKGEGV